MGKPAGRSRLRRIRVRRRLRVERLDERRVLAAITGAVFEDLNLSFHREEGETKLGRRLVFVDSNSNATLDHGEPFALADADGTFRFDNLADGTYLLRLFNGTSSQVQTFPIEATGDGRILAVEEARQFDTRGDETLAITSQAIVIGDLSQDTSASIELGDQLVRMQGLPDGRILVIGSDVSGPTSWLVDPVTGIAEPITLDGQAGETPWRDLAIDGSGRGVLLEQSDESIAIRSVDASRVGEEIQVVATTTLVPPDTTVLTSDTGNRSVLAWGDAEGLQLSLWSNVTASPIESSETPVPDALELLDFDDASGLLAVRTLGGDVRIHDVDAGFAPLHTLEGITGPVLIDGSRELLVTVSPGESLLKLFSLRDGGWIAGLATDLSAIGEVTSLSLRDAQTIAILGAAGITEIALRKPSAHEVTIVDGQDVDSVLFGVALRGANTAPAYATVPTFSTNEDVLLVVDAPGALAGSLDADDDRYVLVQRSEAGHGAAVVSFDGSVSYTPDADFNGGDSVVVLLHDGRDASDEVTLSIEVTPVPDSPTDIIVDIDPIPENLKPGKIVGGIEVIDADGIDNLVIEILDPRFGIEGRDVIFIGGPLDSVDESDVKVSIRVTDTETGTQIERIVAMKVVQSNDPIRSISPDKATVLENYSGGFVAFIGVDDGDDTQTFTLTVDDKRFEVVGNELRLIPGVALDFETEPELTIHITAKENVRNGHTLTEPVTITVGNVIEQPQSIQLTGETVMERIAGEIVGDVLIDGVPADVRFRLLVDDPRFEIVDGTLKLLDDQFVEYASQSEIELRITAQDLKQDFSSISETFVIRVLENEAPFHNHDNPFDVNHSGDVTASDALAIINYLNAYGPGPVSRNPPGYCYDVNDDEMVTPLDALLVVNEVNRIHTQPGTVGSGEGKGEGEAVPVGTAPAPQPTDSPPSPVNQSNGDDVFGDWGGQDEPVGQASNPASTPSGSAQLSTDSPTSVQSKEEFAESVDQTLRLLSDESH